MLPVNADSASRRILSGYVRRVLLHLERAPRALCQSGLWLREVRLELGDDSKMFLLQEGTCWVQVQIAKDMYSRDRYRFFQISFYPAWKIGTPPPGGQKPNQPGLIRNMEREADVAVRLDARESMLRNLLVDWRATWP